MNIFNLENLVSHESNFASLVKPNDASSLKALSEDIQKQMGNVKNRLYISRKYVKQKVYDWA
jgi:hypothetical protein